VSLVVVVGVVGRGAEVVGRASTATGVSSVELVVVGGATLVLG
jgi:hypothetical protein